MKGDKESGLYNFIKEKFRQAVDKNEYFTDNGEPVDHKKPGFGYYVGEDGWGVKREVSFLEYNTLTNKEDCDILVGDITKKLFPLMPDNKEEQSVFNSDISREIHLAIRHSKHNTYIAKLNTEEIRRRLEVPHTRVEAGAREEQHQAEHVVGKER